MKLSLLVRLIAEFGPLAAFFVAMRQGGIFTAMAVFMVATVAALGLSIASERRVPLVPVTTAALVIVFGVLTFFYDDALFVVIRPTVTNLFFGVVLAWGLLRGRLYLKMVLGERLPLDDAVWRKLSGRLVVFLFALAALNELLWRILPLEWWVSAKVFGMPLLNLLFIASQWPLLAQDRTRPAGNGEAAGASEADAAMLPSRKDHKI